MNLVTTDRWNKIAKCSVVGYLFCIGIMVCIYNLKNTEHTDIEIKEAPIHNGGMNLLPTHMAKIEKNEEV